ncbi:MAG TPA: peptide deformylase [Acidimicrobiales bacterium]|nr:peptide deformylase [Acidimicrobiales bacterium]
MVRLPDPVLTTPTAAVDDVTEAAVAELVRDLVDTMRASPACVGLAANQIGVGRRALVVDVTGHRKARSCHGEIVLVNPVLVEAGPAEMGREGCMSVPDLTGDVARSTRVVVRGWLPDGTARTVEADAFEARALLHELDHLDGMVFLDRVASHTSVFRRRVYR